MSETWFDRFVYALGQDRRSMREISMAAGCGPNYLQQVVKDRKQPTVDRLLRVLNQLGTTSILYVLTGATFTEEDEEFFRLVLSLDPELRTEALNFFRAMQGRAGKP